MTWNCSSEQGILDDGEAEQHGRRPPATSGKGRIHMVSVVSVCVCCCVGP